MASRPRLCNATTMAGRRETADTDPRPLHNCGPGQGDQRSHTSGSFLHPVLKGGRPGFNRVLSGIQYSGWGGGVARKNDPSHNSFHKNLPIILLQQKGDLHQQWWHSHPRADRTVPLGAAASVTLSVGGRIGRRKTHCSDRPVELSLRVAPESYRCYGLSLVRKRLQEIRWDSWLWSQRASLPLPQALPGGGGGGMCRLALNHPPAVHRGHATVGMDDPAPHSHGTGLTSVSSSGVDNDTAMRNTTAGRDHCSDKAFWRGSDVST